MLCPVCQRYKLKAIHNFKAELLRILIVVSGMSKIQTESNSQLDCLCLGIYRCCVRYVKDTN